jgi:hypothetical protein
MWYGKIWNDMIWYDIFFNCSFVDTRWQLYIKHLHTNIKQNNTMKQNTQKGTCLLIKVCEHNIKDT